MEFKQGIAYTGLCDVWGGKMWFCVTPDGNDRNYFWTKRDCEKYIRKGFSGEMKTKLLSALRARKGRAFSYA